MSLFETPIEYKSCPNCGERNFAEEEKCTNCGKFLQNKRNIRVGSLIFIFLGIIPSLMGIALLIWLNGEIVEAKQTNLQSGWHGSPATTNFAFGIGALLLTYGIAISAVGAWQLYKGEFYPNLSKAVLRFGWVFWLIGMFIRWLVV